MSPTGSVPLAVVRTLLAVRRRRRLLAGLQALAWMLGGLAVLFALGGLVASSPPHRVNPWLQQGARLWLVAALAGPVALFLIPAWRRTSSLLALARAIDDRVPETRDSLMTAVDLAHALDSGALETDEQTRRLAHAHLGQAERWSASVSALELLPLSVLGRRTLVGPVVAAVVAAAMVHSALPLGSGLRQLLGPSPALAEDGLSDAGTASLVLRNLNLTLTPPAYSGREELVLEGTSGDFQALPGTRVTLSADLPAGGRQLTWHWGGDDAVAHPVEGTHVSFPFVVPGRGHYHLSLERALGRSELQTRRFRVQALPDNPPELEVSAPAGTVDLRSEDEIQIQIRAADDFSLSRLERVVLAGDREIARVPIADVARQAEWSGAMPWHPGLDLSDQGGDVEMIIEAWDNDTVNGPKVTRSRPIEIYVPTARDQHRRALNLKQRLLNESLDFLATLLVDDYGASAQVRMRDEVLAQFDRQHHLALAVLTTASELSTTLQQDRYERRSVFLGISQAVENLARRWQTVVELVETEIRAGQSSAVHPILVGQLLTSRRNVAQELERVVIDLSAFIQLQQGEEALDQLADTEPLLSDLADLVRQAQDGKPVQDALAQALDELAERLDEVARKLAERSRGPDEGFANRLPSDLAPGMLEQIQQLLAEGRYDEAMERVQQAMDAVSDLAENLNQERENQAGSQEAQQLAQQLDEVIQETQRLEQEQEELIEATQELERRFGSGEPLSEQSRRELAEDMDRLHRLIQDLPVTPLPARAQGAVRQRARLAERMSAQMREAYEEGDLDEAIELGETGEAYLDDMDGDLARSQDLGEALRRDARSEVMEAQGLAHSIVERMRRGRRQAEASRQQASGAGQGVRQRQGTLRQGVQALRQQTERIGGSAFNPVAGRDSLDAAGELMERAGQRLGGGQPSHALAAEQDALGQLRQFRESLEASRMAMQSGGSMGAGAMARSGSGRSSLGSRPRSDGILGESGNQDVEMPEPEDFVGPEAFRSLVQEGAAEDAPDRYRPYNHSYYEELVR